MPRQGVLRLLFFTNAPPRSKARASLTILAPLAMMSFLAIVPQAGWVFAAAGNSTQAPGGPSSVNLDLTTGAVVAFILLLLGLAAGILLMGRFLNPKTKS